VVAVQVEAYVAADSRPPRKSLQLLFRLTHECLKEGKVAEFPQPCARVDVDGVPALVNLHIRQHALLQSQCGELAMLGQRLHQRLCNAHVQAVMQARLADVEVCVVGCENDGQVAGSEGRDCVHVGVRLSLDIVGGK
jgi:hypothetical protein